ncbi:MAG: transcriptional regulator [Planctomycetes bacterium]|nr:transcriptional regulator [Planctomycetota bacterium]
MQLHTLKKVTIITEDSLKQSLLKKIIELGATGYTCRQCEGYGSRGARSDQFTRNVEVELICSEVVANDILTYVSHHYFDNYACIAWISDVQVVRGDRYTSTKKS